MVSPRKPRKPRPTGSAHVPTVDGLVWSDQIPEERISWLVPGAIPMGAITLIEGRKGTGKSSLLASIAAYVTGANSLDWLPVVDPRPVIWISGEDHWPSVVVPRLRAAAGNCGMVAKPVAKDSHGRPRPISLPGDLLILEEMIRDSKAGLLVIDPLVSVISSAIDLRIEQSVRSVLEPLQSILADYQCAGLLVRHLRKGNGGDARDAGLGSTAIGNVARSIIRCDEHPHRPGECVASVVSCNLAGRMATRSYVIESTVSGAPVLRWRGTVDLDADAIAEGRGGEGDRDEWGDADRILAQQIGSAWVSVGDLLREAEAAGVSPRTLRRAKARLHIPSRRVQLGDLAHWEWGCPALGWPDGLLESDATENTPRRGRKAAQNGKGANAPPSACVPEIIVEGGTHTEGGALAPLREIPENSHEHETD